MNMPELIMHIGAPKCGSSALQTALTEQPDHQSRVLKTRLRYTGYRPLPGGRLLAVHGHKVKRQGLLSSYGYASWPTPRIHDDPGRFQRALQKEHANGRRRGYVPILSSEGWIGRPGLFADFLAAQGHPRVDVVAFLRPPIEWLNAAWWQWGVWSAPSLQAWLNSGTNYRFAQLLERWSEIPNTRLIVRRSRPNVVGKFAELYGLDLPQAVASNSASPPSLIGFLLRHRQFRPTLHAAAIEFVFQRWCPPVEGARLWAIKVPHVHRLRKITADARKTFEHILDDEALEDLFADPGWHAEKPYHDAILGGASVLDDPADMPALCAALSEGIHRAREQAGWNAAVDLPGWPGRDAGLEAWDDVVADLLVQLRQADQAARRRAIGWSPEALAVRLVDRIGRGVF